MGGEHGRAHHANARCRAHARRDTDGERGFGRNSELTQYFGTDGVRGRVGEAPMTVDFALRLASAAARVLAPEGGRVLIGKDTRVSGYMFESALEAGFVAAGVDVMLIGPLPTPGIAYMTQRLGCSFGVVISASHNRYEDNGIKFFDATGSKLSDEVERQIERLLDGPVVTQESQRLGKAVRIDRSRTQYQEFCASTIPAGMTLEGFKIVVDCANGAGYKVAPRVLADLGAEIVPIGCSPNGRNINDGCGSTAPELLQLTVPGVRAQVGLALDGDGDRVMMVDELGRCVDGDQVLYILAERAARCRRTARPGGRHGDEQPRAWSMPSPSAASSFGARRSAIATCSPCCTRWAARWAGETSGHILCLDKTTTGDGLISALQVLAVMKSTGAGLAELCAPMPKYPQVLLNVRVARRFDPMASPERRRRGQCRGAQVQRAGPHRAAGLRHRTGHSRHGRGLRRQPGESGRARHRGRGRSGGRQSGGARCGEHRGARVRSLHRQALQLPVRAANLRRLSRGALSPKVVAMRRPMVAGNWKMHGSRSANEALLCGSRAAPEPGLAGRRRGISAVCYLADAVRMLEAGAHRRGCAGCVRRARGCLHGTGGRRHAQGCGLPLRDRRALRAAALVSRR